MKPLFILLALLLPLSQAAAEMEEGFTLIIEFDRHTCKIELIEENQTTSLPFDLGEIQVTNDEVYIRQQLLVDKDGFRIGERLIELESLSLADVTGRHNSYTLTFERQKVKPTGRRTKRRGDQISGFDRVAINEKEFIRGDLVTIGGEIIIEGEVNGNVIALFGNIRLAETAICQRNVLAVGGKIKKSRQARIYGAYQSTEKWKKQRPKKRTRYRDDKNVVDLSAGLAYNRVDGLVINSKLTFRSDEKFMPQFYLHYGYGFWSKRSKYRLGFEQTLFDYHQLRFGGSVYRLTKTEDDWICDEKENSIYAIIAREDFRDYYEGEGGDFFIEQTIGFDHTFRFDYKYDQLRFMEANPNLWSLFGGDKKFRTNFSSVGHEFKTAHLEEFDDAEATLKFTYLFNTVDDFQDEMPRTGWVAGLTAEHSSDAIGSDFDYDRHIIELRRYQPLTYRQNLNVRLIYGGVTGEPPLHKLFYLGGIRTLRAYDIKEFYGSRMVMANLEYVIDFPRTSLGVSLLFDIGKIGWDSDFLSEGEFYGDVGVGLSIGEGIRLEFTRQINGFDDTIQFSILLGRSF